jgi:hypothetical protein
VIQQAVRLRIDDAKAGGISSIYQRAINELSTSYQRAINKPWTSKAGELKASRGNVAEMPICSMRQGVTPWC